MRLLVLRQTDEDRMNAHLVDDAPDAIDLLLKEQPTDLGRPMYEFLQEIALTKWQQETLLFLRRMDHAENEPIRNSRWLRFATEYFDDALERPHAERIQVSALRNAADREALKSILQDAERQTEADSLRTLHLEGIAAELRKIAPVTVP